MFRRLVRALLFQFLIGYFEPLPLPRSFDALAVNLPAWLPQQGRNPATNLAAELGSQFDHARNQVFSVSAASWQISLRGSIFGPELDSGAVSTP
mgnify:CR=1 FL=1